MSNISVVVISKDEGFLSETLAVLENQCSDVEAECVVVDASRGRLSHVRDAHVWVRWHDYIPSAGRTVTIPHQRNVGVSVATGDVIVFCDAGGIPETGWLSHLTSPILAGLASATGGPIRSRHRYAYDTLNDLPTGAVLRQLVTSNVAFTRELFDRVGGFDERYDYGSDTDFGWRIELAGEEVVSVSDAVMTIDWGDLRRQLRRDWRYGEAKARQWLLHPDRRRKIIQESPEVLLYPLLVLTTPLAVLAAIITRRRVPLTPWLVALAILYARDRRFGIPLDAMLGHVALGLGICRELTSAVSNMWGDPIGP